MKNNKFKLGINLSNVIRLSSAETTMPRGAKTSQKKAPPKHRELSQRVDVDDDVYAVSSDSSNNEESSAMLS